MCQKPNGLAANVLLQCDKRLAPPTSDKSANEVNPEFGSSLLTLETADKTTTIQCLFTSLPWKFVNDWLQTLQM